MPKTKQYFYKNASYQLTDRSEIPRQLLCFCPWCCHQLTVPCYWWSTFGHWSLGRNGAWQPGMHCQTISAICHAVSVTSSEC